MKTALNTVSKNHGFPWPYQFERNKLLALLKPQDYDPMHLIFASIISILGLSYSLIREDRKSKVWNLIMSVGLVIFWLGLLTIPRQIAGFGVFVFLIGAIGILRLQLQAPNLSNSYKTLFIFLAFFGVSSFIFRMMHWPGSGMAMLLSIGPVIMLFISLRNKQIPKNGIRSGLIVFGLLCLFNFCYLASTWFN